MKRPLLYLLFTLTVTLMLPAISFTQRGTRGAPPPPPPDPIDTNIPFDGGLSILLAVGVGYGVKRIRDQRMQKKKDINNDL